MTPLSARVYLEAYHDPSNPIAPQFQVKLLNEFHTWDIISLAALQNTWPEGAWEESETDQGGSDEMAVPKLEKTESTTRDTSKSLRDRAMATVFQTLLDGSDDNYGLLLEAEVLTDILPRLKGRLYAQANSLKPSHHLLDVLCRALKNDTDVDLSPFKGFSAEAMSLVVSRLRKHGTMITLCISNRPDLTEEDLQVVLRGAAGLKALYILEVPQIPIQRVNMLLDDCDIFHSDLLRRPITPETNPIGDATLVCAGRGISQLVYIPIRDHQACDREYRRENGLIDWQRLREYKGLGSFGKGRGSYDRDEPYLGYKRHMLDIPLPTFKTVAGLLDLLKWGVCSHCYRTWDTGKFSRWAAFSFAMASSNPVSGGPAVEYGIGPLSTSLYLDSTYGRIPPSEDHEHLEFGQWAVVLIHEAFNALDQEKLDTMQRGKDEVGWLRRSQRLIYKFDTMQQDKNQDLSFKAIKRLRYALVTPSIKPNPLDHDFMVADIPTYLEHMRNKVQDKANDRFIRRLIRIWNTDIADIDGVDFYGDEDIHDILSKVFPKQRAPPPASSP